MNPPPRPKLLDLFCSEGGAAVGYHQAGFSVTGIDIDRKPARRYPYNFILADALQYAAEHGHEYDAIHASPPCQGYSRTAVSMKPEQLAKYPKLIPEVRELLDSLGKPYIIENVVGAPLQEPVLLCGSMFALEAPDIDGTPLRLERHRLFESNMPITAPSPCVHDRSIQVAGVYGGGSIRRKSKSLTDRRGGYTPVKEVRALLMGIGHMSQLGLSEAIPPAYTRWLGAQLLHSMEMSHA
ncbi:DNA methyltransferase [Arthrobacter phage Pureglobe5]|nr:DNA methyltransferase [Arthrobacter phage Beagle]QOP66771.1 DNA methyltransferase [Arthrobacter phage Odyssey395]UYL87384.1 DNA methyltransferase [Arthrobacter phage Pureglobe5]